MFTFLFVTFHNLLAPTKSQDLSGSSKIYTQTHTHAGKHVNAHTSGTFLTTAGVLKHLIRLTFVQKLNFA